MNLKVVTYHWIRPRKEPRYPRRKGIDEAAFIQQVEYLQRHYQLVTMDEIIDAFASGTALPDRACHLTFDDGHREHYTVAFPILVERGIQATFFPPSAPLLEHTLLDVHKLHLILASHDDHGALCQSLLDIVDELRREHPNDIPPQDALIERFMQPGRFDAPETWFIKRVCDVGLPRDIRGLAVQRLFERTTGDDGDESMLVADLYMSASELRDMAGQGMGTGAHGHHHLWLGELDPVSQQQEIDASLRLLRQVHGTVPKRWVMSYPYGSYNDTTIQLVRRRGCAVAFATTAGLVSRHSDPLALPRIDTHDVADEMTSQAHSIGRAGR